MKMHLHAIAAAGFLTACGDAMRTPEFEGDPAFSPLLIRARWPDGFDARPGAVLGFLSVNGERGLLGGRLRVRAPRRAPDPAARELQAVLAVPPDDDSLASPPSAAPRGSGTTLMHIARPLVSEKGYQLVTLNDFVVYAAYDLDPTFPLGVGGPALPVKAGFQLVRRVCEPSGTVRLEALPSSTVLDLVALPYGVPTATGYPKHEVEIEAFARCGATLPAEDLGARVEVGPDRIKARGTVLHSSNGRLFFLPALAADRPAAQVDAVDPTTGTIETLLRGRFTTPLAVSTEGRYLFAWSTDPDPRADPTPRLVRLDTTTAALVKGPTWGMPSPDGRFALSKDIGPATQERQLMIYDFATGTERAIAPGNPLAWAPDSASVLSTRWSDSNVRVLERVKLDGTVEPVGTNPVVAPHAWFWSGGAAHAIQIDNPILDRPTGITVTTVVPGAPAGPTTATVVAPLDQPDSLANMAFAADAGQIFVWSERCLGFGPSLCTARLHRYSLATGTSSVVAQARTPMPVAVSPDGRRLALSADGAIFVKDLSASPM